MRHRFYSSNKLKFWVNSRCKLCNRFLRHFTRNEICAECSREIYVAMDIEIRSISRRSIRDAIYPEEMSRGLEKILGSSYYR